MGELVLWTSEVGIQNIFHNKKFFAYSEKSEMHNVQIIIPISAVCTHEVSGNHAEGIQFYCHEKELW